jgi:polyisoprenyl-phosphate glycosyltransferase
MPQQLLSVIVPVLNEAANLGELSSRLRKVLDGLDIDWEVIAIDDGSTDSTLAALRALHDTDPRFRAVSLSRNFGKERAIAAGLAYAQGDAAVLIDADLQHPPEVIAEFLTEWRKGFDIVYGQRIDRNTEGPVRRYLARAFYRLFKTLSRTSLPPGAGDFRLLSRRAVDAMNRFGERERFNKGLYSWIGFPSVGVPYRVAERKAGFAKWSPRKLIHFALDGIFSFSTMPLRISAVLGLLISLGAVGYGFYFLIYTLMYGIDRPGFPSLIISIMFLSGVQLVSLGIVGEYLGRVYEEVKARPLFLVAEEVGFSQRPGATRVLDRPRTPNGGGHA